MIAACKSPKNIQKENGSTEINVPFTGKEFQTDKEFFRAKQVGKSVDLATAKKIALLNAKSELASNINSTIKKVTDQYTNQRTISNTQEYENKFEENVREVVSQNLNNVNIENEKIFKEKDDSYSYWVVIEISKKTILDGINNKASQNAKIQLDYDKKQFEEIFNIEMQKQESK